ncbi:hypothetical protein BNJ_00072 [Kaumoebavirus]|nr:hypothetical protein BNJ_00072 [Kaumoebavirus]ARA71914.1 hypothetical protein BNJ_00072 [Kaumoebavirus]
MINYGNFFPNKKEYENKDDDCGDREIKELHYTIKKVIINFIFQLMPYRN